MNGTVSTTVSTLAPGMEPTGGTMSSVLKLVIELQQARYELVNAWRMFKYGSVPPIEAVEEGVPDDRLSAVMNTVAREIQELYMLAEEIRSRS